MRIAVTGHCGLRGDVYDQVDRAVREALARIDQGGSELVGLSCLADGADQIFGAAILDLGGSLEVVIPAEEYRAGLPDDAKPLYDELYHRATAIYRRDHRESTAEAHMDASKFMVDNADQIIAVWDGLPARSYGGTADVVAYSNERGVPVMVIWPPGASRD